MLVDTHCHIYKEYYEDIDSLMDKLNSCGISKVINNGCDFKTAKDIIELSNIYDNMYFTIGLHPEENLSELDSIVELIKDNLNNKKFIGIGEIGLDYYWNKENKEDQIKVFEIQLKIAQEYNLPVIIHSREATGDMLSILKKYNLRGTIHCFNGSVEVAREYIKMGYKFGINGVITFKNCKLIDVIREVGIYNIVFETDSPYLTPVPDRGKKNDPSYVNVIVDFISNELGIEREVLVDISNKNVSDIFDI